MTERIHIDLPDGHIALNESTARVIYAALRARFGDPRKERHAVLVQHALPGALAAAQRSPMNGYLNTDRAAEEAVWAADAALLIEEGHKLADVEELREKLRRQESWDKTGLYEHAHEDTIPEVGTPAQTRHRLEQLVAIVKALEHGISSDHFEATVRKVQDEIAPLLDAVGTAAPTIVPEPAPSLIVFAPVDPSAPSTVSDLDIPF